VLSIGIADVVEMDAINVVAVRDLHHRIVAEIPVHLPDVDLDAVLPARRDAGGKRIVLRGDAGCSGQHFARKIGGTAPEHVRHDGREAALPEPRARATTRS
jgi:hypothetical protein